MQPIFNPWEKQVKRVEEENRLILSEGLIKSYSPQMLIRQLTINFNLKQYQFSIGVENSIQFNYPTDISKDAKFTQIIELNGYFISKSHKTEAHYFIQLEPKYPTRINVAKMPDYLYHVTPAINENKIKKIGLTPKESKTSFSHTGNRIYLLLTFDQHNDLPKLVDILRNDRNELKGASINDVYLALEIKKNNDNIYFYDPMFGWGKTVPNGRGIFALKNIPPSDIKIIGELG
jgi:hypothetical protein